LLHAVSPHPKAGLKACDTEGLTPWPLAPDPQPLDKGERIDVVVLRIDRRLDRLGPFALRRAFPEGDVVMALPRQAIAPEDHAHTRPMRIGRVNPQHDGNLAGVEAHEV